MTYREFLLFVFAPGLVAVVSALAIRVAGGRHQHGPLRTAALGVCGVLPVAVVFTTPWDSWLIAKSVWGYPPHSVMGTVFRVPVEEYLFMAGLTLFTGCWTVLVAATTPRSLGTGETGGVGPFGPIRSRRWFRVVTGTACVVVAVAGGVAVAVTPRATYLGSLVAWFGVPLAVQAYSGADILHSRRRALLSGLALTPVLWVEDTIAVKSGAWHISDAGTVGLRVLGLPLEEILFFLVVNLLIVNTILLLTNARWRVAGAGLSGGNGQSEPGEALARPYHGHGVPVAGAPAQPVQRAGDAD